MSKFIKLLCLVIALTMVLSIGLTGCSGDKPDNDQTKAGEEETTPIDPVTKEPLKPVTLHWYNVSSSVVNDADTNKVVAEVNKILKKKLNVTLKYYLFDAGTYEDKLNVKISGGDPVDLSFASLVWVNKYPIGVSSGKFLQLDDLLNKYGKNILAATKQEFLDCAKVQDKTYAIMNVQNYAFGKGIMFQKSLVEELGLQADIDKLKYKEDLGELLGKVKNIFDNDPKYSKYTVIGGIPNMPNKMQEKEQEDIGGTPFAVMRGDTTLTPIIPFITDWGKYGMGLTREFFLKGYISKEAAIVKEWGSVFRKGKVFCTSVDGTKPGVGEEASIRFGMPVIVKETTEPILKTQDILAVLTVIPSASKNPERAMMLADLMFVDKEAYNTLVWGVKGLHYEMVNENTIKLLPEQKNYNPMNQWAAGNTFNAYLTDQEDPNRWEETKKRNETAEYETTFGFTLDTSKYQSEYAQLSEIMTRNFRQLNSGLVDVDSQLAKLDTELKNLGYERLFEDVKQQLAAFRDKKKAQ